MIRDPTLIQPSSIVWEPKAVRTKDDVIAMNHALTIAPRRELSRRAFVAGLDVVINLRSLDAVHRSPPEFAERV